LVCSDISACVPTYADHKLSTPRLLEQSERHKTGDRKTICVFTVAAKSHLSPIQAEEAKFAALSSLIGRLSRAVGNAAKNVSNIAPSVDSLALQHMGMITMLAAAAERLDDASCLLLQAASAAAAAATELSGDSGAGKSERQLKPSALWCDSEQAPLIQYPVSTV